MTETIKITSEPGTVTLLNHSGSDATIACAAVVHNAYDEMLKPQAKHDRLVDEMPRAGHWGTLDHCHVTMLIQCPIFVARQILRSSEAKFNEISMRYAEPEPLFYVPETFYKDVKRKELGGVPEPVDEHLQAGVDMMLSIQFQKAWDVYSAMIYDGIRKEQARIVLPVTTFTKFWMTLPLSAWYHFLNLRTDPHSQEETRFIADKILEKIRNLYPITTSNWENYAKGPLPSGCIQTP